MVLGRVVGMQMQGIREEILFDGIVGALGFPCDFRVDTLVRQQPGLLVNGKLPWWQRISGTFIYKRKTILNIWNF